MKLNSWQRSGEFTISTRIEADCYVIEKRTGVQAKLSRSQNGGPFLFIEAFDTIEEAMEATKEIVVKEQS